MKLLKVDWSELEEAFQDDSGDHRYYLDRDTGEVHFFSSYLENDEEQEDEQHITSEERYVSIPLSRRMVTSRELDQFIRTLTEDRVRKLLSSTLREQEAHARFQDVLNGLPEAREKWSEFQERVVQRRIRDWLDEVGVQPLNE